MLRILFSTLFALFISSLSFAQNDIAPCSTNVLGQWQQSFLQSYQQSPERLGITQRGMTLYVPVKVHIVSDDNGNGGYPVDQVLRNLCEVNNWYRDANIHFYMIDAISFINESAYYNHSFQQGRSMMNLYSVNNRVNIFIVNDPAGACGYYSPFGDAVALRKSCLGPGNTTMAHELGHYLSMPHTFNGWEGGRPPTQYIERADGTNCQTAGDGFCDTPADYLADRWVCPYNDKVLIDPVGDTVIPDGTQIMSYSNDACQTGFSNSQNGAMRAYLITQRNNLINQGQPETSGTSTQVQLVSPADNAIAGQNNNVTLSWRQMPDASIYHVEVSSNPVFAQQVFSNMTRDTVITIQGLNEGETYYWRVSAMNTGNYCVTQSSIAKSFVVGNQVGIGTSPALQSMMMYPNPAPAGGTLTLQYPDAAGMDGQIYLTTMTGQTVRHWTVDGQQPNRQLSLAGIAKGLYLIRMVTEDGEAIRRLIIQ